MHRLRLLLLLSLMFAVGGTAVARAQDGTTVFNDQGQKSDIKHNKAKNKDQSNDGHRKHWYSPPHWFHKKHNSGTSAKSAKTPSGKTVAASTTTKPSDVKPLNNKRVATTTTGHKTVAGTTASAKTTTATAQHRKTLAANRRRKRPVGKSGCTPEQAKKGGCTTDKSPSQKGAATASAAKPS